MKSEEEKYAELIISMSTDFLSKKISLDHYLKTLDVINSKVQKMYYDDNQRIADELIDKNDL